MKKSLSLVLALMLCLGAVGAMAAETDAVSSASTDHYADRSLTWDTIADAINNRTGAVTVATVDEDGSPRIGVFIPGFLGEKHLMFGLAPSISRDNIVRTKEAMIAFYIYNPGADDSERNGGARLRVVLEEDEEVIQTLTEGNERYNPDSSIIMRIEELLPIG